MVQEELEGETDPIYYYWNKVTKDLVPEPGSLMYKVLNNFCLMCNETSADATVWRESESGSLKAMAGFLKLM